jgi:hypothetical protein
MIMMMMMIIIVIVFIIIQASVNGKVDGGTVTREQHHTGMVDFANGV